VPDAGSPAFAIRMFDLAGFSGQAFDVVALRQVDDDRPAVLRDQLLQHVAPSAGDNEPPATVGDGLRDRMPDAAGGAREQHSGPRNSHTAELRCAAVIRSGNEAAPEPLFLGDNAEGLGGRVTAGNSPARAGDSPVLLARSHLTCP
jgi:hypothetical protein